MPATVTATNDDKATLAMPLLTNQAEKLTTTPFMNQAEQSGQPEPQAVSCVLDDKRETAVTYDTCSFEAPSIAKADAFTTAQPDALANSSNHVFSASDDFISAQIQTYAS